MPRVGHSDVSIARRWRAGPRLMRYALISDIHANLPALDAVLADIAAQAGVGATYHLGDLVGYAPWPNEVVDRIRTSGIEGVAGNYDSTVATDYKHCGCRYEDKRQEELSHLSYAWTREHVSADTKAYLASLPFRIDLRPLGGHLSGPTMTLLHGNQTLNTVYVTEDRSDDFLTKMGDAVGAREGDIVAFGHTHQAVAPDREWHPLREHRKRRPAKGRRSARGLRHRRRHVVGRRGRIFIASRTTSPRRPPGSWRAHCHTSSRRICALVESRSSTQRPPSSMLSLARRCVAEFLGTFALVAIGPGAVMVAARTHAFGHLGVSLAFGLIVTLVVAGIGDLSGAHINPAVTVGFWSVGRFPRREVAPYVLAQCIGAIAASAACGWLLGSVGDFGATLPSLTLARSFAVEMGFTGLLGFVIMAVSDDKRTSLAPPSFVIGATVFAGALVTGPLTGGSFNPARSLGPAVLSGVWTAHWLYWIAPILGMTLSMRLYRWLRSSRQITGETTTPAESVVNASAGVEVTSVAVANQRSFSQMSSRTLNT